MILSKRGFYYHEFTDRYGEKCSIQDSSLATEPAIWLGCDENTKPHHVDGECSSPRMHLTIDMAIDLVNLLNNFIATGSINR